MIGGESFGKIFITIGIAFIIIGILFFLGSRIGIGRLPGDIYIRKGNFTFYFPIVTSILISIILSLLLFLFRSR
ncbi:hypothetical protein H0A61_02365 [Koleobacter methoxysyntrophicus]|jgi:multisubunit Na+/H+ antiporter MnhG subunit|uniref:DUF2905 domain-containing protein n=1 Tax=Koleobacter methoxysyntrophicus TaxID=2751313 RepID=A0A8A0RNY2_9FIRM|nr:DUF2905 domain-containing protein [Koleobacter methoxysyntrophicus]MDI3540895.1 hypothetical protein [Thermosediminibacterales bacterium]MDK2901332.1 hypothetical protein [Thermosediminibacterales bacterium]QSQ09973.1 hypothetical protein H0A61_02365 [Koleobacter methoxysyntrophicus]